MTVLLILIDGLLNAFGQFFLKTGVDKMLFPLIGVGIFIYGVSMLLWLYILSKAQLSFAYALLAISFVFMLLISKFLLNEVISPLRIFGSAIIIFGVFLVSKS